MIRRILVGLGGTPLTAAAIRQAVDLAAKHKTELTGVTLADFQRATLVDQEPPESGILVSKKLGQAHQFQERIESAIADFHAMAEAAGVAQHTVVYETGEAFSKLIDLARFHDVVVCGLKKLLKYEFASGDPLEVLVRFMTSGVQPVLSVGESPRDIKRALIAFSGSAESTRAMKRFVQFQLFRGVKIRVVTFGDDEAARSDVESAAEYCRIHGFEAEAHLCNASPKAQLLAEAENYGADVIVIGSSARKTFLRRMLGDTALQVIKNSPIPLFICQ